MIRQVSSVPLHLFTPDALCSTQKYFTTNRSVKGLVRLSKRMSELDLCSRREADALIARGDGSILLKGVPVDPILGQKVASDEKDIVILPPNMASTIIIHSNSGDSTSWWERLRGEAVVMNKPEGFVSGQPNLKLNQIPAVTFLTKNNFYLNLKYAKLSKHNADKHGAAKLNIDKRDMELWETYQNNHLSFEETNKRLYNNMRANSKHSIHQCNKRLQLMEPTLTGYVPAGRLDKDSTGLLVFTRSGIVAKKLISHQTRIEKEYIVTLQSISSSLHEYYSKTKPKLSIFFEANNYLSGDHRPLLPVVEAEWISNQKQTNPRNSQLLPYTLRLVLKEGRKRQIRRMCEEILNLRVVGLKRIRIGPIHLGNLLPGTWRPLRKKRDNIYHGIIAFEQSSSYSVLNKTF